MALVTKTIQKILSDLTKNWFHFCFSANKTHLEFTYNYKIGHFLNLYTSDYPLIPKNNKKVEKCGHITQKHPRQVVRFGQKLVQFWLRGTYYFSCKSMPQILPKLQNITLINLSHLFFKHFHDAQGSGSDKSFQTMTLRLPILTNPWNKV